MLGIVDFSAQEDTIVAEWQGAAGFLLVRIELANGSSTVGPVVYMSRLSHLRRLGLVIKKLLFSRCHFQICLTMGCKEPPKWRKSTHSMQKHPALNEPL